MSSVPGSAWDAYHLLVRYQLVVGVMHDRLRLDLAWTIRSRKPWILAPMPTVPVLQGVDEVDPHLRRRARVFAAGSRRGVAQPVVAHRRMNRQLVERRAVAVLPVVQPQP